MLIFLAGLFILACNNQNANKEEKKVKYSDLVNEQLTGEVQLVEESPYKVDSSGKVGDMDSCCIDVVEYDENGNAIRYTSKDSKGNIKSQSVYTRHETGLWVGSTDTKEGGKPVGSMKVGVDEKGHYTIAEAFDSTGKLEFYYTETKQNDFGQVIAWKQYDKDSVFRAQGEATYNKNLQTGFVMKDSVGKIKSSSAYKYNDKGEQTEVSNTAVTKDSTTTKLTKYTYETHDESGNWTQRTTWDEKGKATKTTKRVYTYRKKE